MTTKKEERPKVKVVLTWTDYFLETLCWLVIVFMWAMLAWSYSDIPETIPTHFNFTGKPDNFGIKGSLFILPVVSSLLYIGMSILNKYPHAFNYPTKITMQNAEKQYTIATKLIRYLKFMVVLTFSLIVLLTFWTANNHATLPVVWVVPVFIALFYIPMVYGIVRMFKTS